MWKVLRIGGRRVRGVQSGEEIEIEATRGSRGNRQDKKTKKKITERHILNIIRYKCENGESNGG